MPIIESAIKRAGQNIKRRGRLLPYRTNVKTMIRKVGDLAKAGKMDEAKKMLPQAYKAIDMAAKKHIIHRSNAARKKSALAKLTTTEKK